MRRDYICGDEIDLIFGEGILGTTQPLHRDLEDDYTNVGEELAN